MKKTLLIIISGLFFITGVFATDDDLMGSDVTDKGSIQTLTGIFIIDDENEWYLNVKDQLFDVHKGPDWYTEEIVFTAPEEVPVIIEGFVFNSAISPCTITIGNRLYSFRTLEGQPLWSGRGNRRNEQTGEL